MFKRAKAVGQTCLREISALRNVHDVIRVHHRDGMMRHVYQIRALQAMILELVPNDLNKAKLAAVAGKLNSMIQSWETMVTIAGACAAQSDGDFVDVESRFRLSCKRLLHTLREFHVLDNVAPVHIGITDNFPLVIEPKLIDDPWSEIERKMNDVLDSIDTKSRSSSQIDKGPELSNDRAIRALRVCETLRKAQAQEIGSRWMKPSALSRQAYHVSSRLVRERDHLLHHVARLAFATDNPTLHTLVGLALSHVWLTELNFYHEDTDRIRAYLLSRTGQHILHQCAVDEYLPVVLPLWSGDDSPGEMRLMLRKFLTVSHPFLTESAADVWLNEHKTETNIMHLTHAEMLYDKPQEADIAGPVLAQLAELRKTMFKIDERRRLFELRNCEFLLLQRIIAYAEGILDKEITPGSVTQLFQIFFHSRKDAFARLNRDGRKAAIEYDLCTLALITIFHHVLVLLRVNEPRMNQIYHDWQDSVIAAAARDSSTIGTATGMEGVASQLAGAVTTKVVEGALLAGGAATVAIGGSIISAGVTALSGLGLGVAVPLMLITELSARIIPGGGNVRMILIWVLFALLMKLMLGYVGTEAGYFITEKIVEASDLGCSIIKVFPVVSVFSNISSALAVSSELEIARAVHKGRMDVFSKAQNDLILFKHVVMVNGQVAYIRANDETVARMRALIFEQVRNQVLLKESHIPDMTRVRENIGLEGSVEVFRRTDIDDFKMNQVFNPRLRTANMLTQGVLFFGSAFATWLMHNLPGRNWDNLYHELSLGAGKPNVVIDQMFEIVASSLALPAGLAFVLFILNSQASKYSFLREKLTTFASILSPVNRGLLFASAWWIAQGMSWDVVVNKAFSFEMLFRSTAYIGWQGTDIPVSQMRLDVLNRHAWSAEKMLTKLYNQTVTSLQQNLNSIKPNYLMGFIPYGSVMNNMTEEGLSEYHDMMQIANNTFAAQKKIYTANATDQNWLFSSHPEMFAHEQPRRADAYTFLVLANGFLSWMNIGHNFYKAVMYGREDLRESGLRLLFKNKDKRLLAEANIRSALADQARPVLTTPNLPELKSSLLAAPAQLALPSPAQSSLLPAEATWAFMAREKLKHTQGVKFDHEPSDNEIFAALVSKANLSYLNFMTDNTIQKMRPLFTDEQLSKLVFGQDVTAAAETRKFFSNKDAMQNTTNASRVRYLAGLSRSF